MSAKDRAALITKLHKACKKKYDVVMPPSGRTVLEHLVYAACLEDSTYDAADETFARLQSEFFDWNEVRVTNVRELAEIGRNTTFPEQTAARIKKTLHGVFETFYSFEIDHLKKENLSKSVATFEKQKGITPFVISYVAQHGLGGHSIPLDRSMLNLFFVAGVISEAEMAKGKVPGLERTIPKNKGLDFSSVVHQLAVALIKSPFNKDVRAFLLTIAPDAKERFAKRGARKKKEPEKKEPEKKEAEKKEPEKKQPEKKSPAAKSAKKTGVKKSAAKKASPKKTPAKKKVAAKKSTKKVAGKKKTVARKTGAKKKAAKKTSTKKKSPTKRLARKKPR